MSVPVALNLIAYKIFFCGNTHVSLIWSPETPCLLCRRYWTRTSDPFLSTWYSSDPR